MLDSYINVIFGVHVLLIRKHLMTFTDLALFRQFNTYRKQMLFSKYITYLLKQTIHIKKIIK